MNLKKLLIEKQLKDVLNNFKMNIEYPLYRGSTNVLKEKSWKIKKIRKDRIARGGADSVNVFIDWYVSKKYDNVPKRKESKFATTEKSTAKDYGDYVNVVFPEKNANIVSFVKDSIIYRNKIGNSVHFFKSNLSKIKDIKVLHKLAESMKRYDKGKINVKQLKQVFSDTWPKIKNNKDQIKNKLKVIESSGIGRSDLDMFFKGLKQYISNKNFGIYSGSEEVMFDGDQYLILQDNFFQNNFDWNGRKWEMT